MAAVHRLLANQTQHCILRCNILHQAACPRASPAKAHHSRSSGTDAEAVTSILEGADQATVSQGRFIAESTHILNASTEPAAASSNPKEPVYKALLAIILHLCATPQESTAAAAAAVDHHQQQQRPQQQQQQQLDAFLQAQPVATSIPFISWIADLEAKATGAQKAQLAHVCELLVSHREKQEQQQQEQLYQDTLKLLAGGNEQVTALLSSEPRHYALALAEGLTGQAVAMQGYSPAYDVLLQVAPAAAMTPESVAQGHQLAAELQQELSSRRKSTLAAMLGRTRLTAEQQAQLMGGTPAARICDLLLTFDGSDERIALLPDCFTPPDDLDAAAAAGSSDDQQQQQQQQDDADEETEELWCTPMQLLNEIESRLKAVAANAAQQQGMQQLSRGALPTGSSSSGSIWQQQQLPAGESDSLTGDALVSALTELRDVIREQWLDSLPRER